MIDEKRRATGEIVWEMSDTLLEGCLWDLRVPLVVLKAE